MIRGTQAAETPDLARHRAVIEGVPLTPPEVPEPAHVIIRRRRRSRQIVGQQAPDAQQTRLQNQGSEPGVSGVPPRLQFCQSLHRPEVLFVPKRTEQAFPESLLPARLAGARLQLQALEVESQERRLVQKLRQTGGGQPTQRRGALTGWRLRQFPDGEGP